MSAHDDHRQSDYERVLAMLAADPHCRSVRAAGPATIMFVSQAAIRALHRRDDHTQRPKRVLTERSDIEIVEWLDSDGCDERTGGA